MIVKETPWEERNLGVAGCEFYVGLDDNTSKVMDAISHCKAKYQVLHIDSGNTDTLFAAQGKGFLFIETNIRMQLKMKSISLPAIYKRFEEHISFTQATEEEVKKTLDVVESGAMFTTDKIARDPYWNAQKAGYRYSLWAKDMLEKGAVMVMPKYKDQIIGFDMNYLEKGIEYNDFLGGVFPEFSSKGLGFIVLYSNLLSIFNQGGRIVNTGVSSNNLSILKLHELFGFTVTKMSYTLIKHIEGEGI